MIFDVKRLMYKIVAEKVRKVKETIFRTFFRQKCIFIGMFRENTRENAGGGAESKKNRDFETRAIRAFCSG
jgi:hypothetical protein